MTGGSVNETNEPPTMMTLTGSGSSFATLMRTFVVLSLTNFTPKMDSACGKDGWKRTLRVGVCVSAIGSPSPGSSATDSTSSWWAVCVSYCAADVMGKAAYFGTSGVGLQGSQAEQN